MAELIIGNVVESITGDLLSVISEEIRLARVVKVELRKFQQTVSIIGIVLREAGKRQIEDENVNHWLMELIDVIYDADDLLGDFSTEVLRRRIVMGGGGNRILSEVSIFFSSSNQLVHQFKMAHRLKKMRERIDAISHDRSLFRIGGYNDLIGSLVENQVRPETSPYERWPYVIGRDKDKNEIIEFLLNTDFDENVTVLPIVGIGGLGKTTLARLVFNDKSVKEYFELKLWEKLGEELHGKKFLLVLDDVWNENPREWLKLHRLLQNGTKGSKILVTTRTPRVARTMTDALHELSGLSEEESLSLLKRITRKEALEWRNQNLEMVAKEILKKCAGVPLAIMTIG
ncbi:putative disease resistance protein RGA3 isoform X2 [Punica granatum]|uniref:Disease resistance protein RGA3 isoform X2 n=1 Tax=Punica granatum TaxID=22663 RepID=A0A6P8BPT2_PUNGR|nr:putative disease resistance protein RGA3 isoform X2 [Punica granatum]